MLTPSYQRTEVQCEKSRGAELVAIPMACHRHR
uniref:Uncharacterized protein n=1 Tax=Anguilla anguilla TaxID=7936 RepID=A0A0E9T9Z4_ANGAN